MSNYFIQKKTNKVYNERQSLIMSFTVVASANQAGITNYRYGSAHFQVSNKLWKNRLKQLYIIIIY